MIDDLTVPRLTYGEAVLERAVSRPLAPIDLCSLDDFLLDVTSRKDRREPTMMDLLVAEALREPGPTRRWFLRAGLTIGAVAFLSIFPGAPVSAAGATFFVSPTGDNGAATTWATGKTTITAGIAVCGAGDYLLVDSTYAVSAGAAVTWTPPAGGLAIISVTPSGGAGFSAFTTGAAESVGAANSAFTIAQAASSRMYLSGLVINSGTNNSTACDIIIFSAITSLCSLEAVSCTFDLKSIAASTQLSLGALGGTAARAQSIKLTNCTFICSGSRAGTYCFLGSASVELINPTFSMSGATKPAILFADGDAGGASNPGGRGPLIIRDGDITGYAVASGAYFSVANFAWIQVLMENLKISATPTLTTGTWLDGVSSITRRNVDSGDTIYTFAYTNAFGELTADTSIFVTAGKQFNGAGVSWKIVTTAAATEFAPFVTPALFVWDTTTSVQTSAIEIVRDNATLLTNKQIWSSLDSPASVSFPNYTYQTNRNTQPFVGTAADQPTSTAAWTGISGFTNQTKQKLENAFTAAEVGTLQARVSVAVASTTLYVAPYIGGVT